MDWGKLLCALVGLVIVIGGITMVAVGAVGGDSDAMALEAETIDEGSEQTCTVSTDVLATDCRDTEICVKRVSNGKSTSCGQWDPLRQCYCESTYTVAGKSYTARFSVTSTDTDKEDTAICSEALSAGDTWPNFLAFNSDKSKYAYCGFRAYKADITEEGTSLEDSSSSCITDLALDADYKCLTTIKVAGFPCVQASDGRVFAGSKSDLVSQREDCSSTVTSTYIVILVFGIILIIFGCVWITSLLGCSLSKAWQTLRDGE
mmetsp:Transcript_6169/g.14326  ORF Transcript_6169/g.14326 Transcript_6169/m.14326 type:complete len:261 (-) Transcript_6169:321-1103(-)|eukprot:CAMPEP_0206458124 /NCGR_PEP_ID=MMETSP0324_2-20121206/23373_1 /ASSEMBLY_ACC=CAM_ASM_000836 /TAXON_ID=2866 /ORGANISM="Crypthecodinium cohnii, Strain Seligo" /LENGTH=260 /DNA_ID=CAMNT_0053929383 /DNA_START=102 /DNA_END=884 /DNA_ORIENTATION=-